MKRVRAIDQIKGLAVTAMVLCHILQFFGKSSQYPEQYGIMTAINALAFPTFLFAYGRSVALAYGSQPWKQAAPRMMKSMLRSYLAFCLSGIAYLVLCEQKDFSSRVVLRVILLKSIPGWSEFLISFALFALATLILLPAMKKLADCSVALAAVCAACLLGVLIPYDRIQEPRLGLIVGTTEFACFPVLQYMPVFLLGFYAQMKGMKRTVIWLGASAVLTGIAVAASVQWGEPSRFPPSLMWLLLPCLPIVALTVAFGALEAWTEDKKVCRQILSPVEYMGMNSLFFLLASNFVIFATSRMGTLPTMRRSERFPFTLETGSTPWALFWALVLLLGIGYMIGLTRKRKRIQ